MNPLKSALALNTRINFWFDQMPEPKRFYAFLGIAAALYLGAVTMPWSLLGFWCTGLICGLTASRVVYWFTEGNENG